MVKRDDALKELIFMLNPLVCPEMEVGDFIQRINFIEKIS